jgi:hypothetical protein
MKTIAFVLAALALPGCATVEDSEPGGPPAEVSVYREPSSLDSLFPMLFTVDGRAVTQLHPGDKHSFELPAGDHRFAFEIGVNNCRTNVNVESGKAYVYRLAQRCVIALDDGTSSPGEAVLASSEPWRQEGSVNHAEDRAGPTRLPPRPSP